MADTTKQFADGSCIKCKMLPPIKVHHEPGKGWYIGTHCKCGPFTRESIYYTHRVIANRKFDLGTWERIK